MRGKPCRRHPETLGVRIIPAHAGQTPQFGNGVWVETDHPRACGANKLPNAAALPVAGSSPRMRGKLDDSSAYMYTLRIIPAHAGQTGRVERASCFIADHPRACGANWCENANTVGERGSSPRMRGKRTGHRDIAQPHRIIPAHAGQTPKSAKTATSETDHPRACGANDMYLHLLMELAGSSPRMRGKLRLQHSPKIRLRIIPAHAGQTAYGARSTFVGTDHPRACGANLASRRFHHGLSGSSPRMRGKPPLSFSCWTAPRIIPAHAGQTCERHVAGGIPSDHPRACGANSGLTYPIPSVAGSSPRMRGKLECGHELAGLLRIIPAHAGQTVVFSHPVSCAPDHPRACGANQVEVAPFEPVSGSSPRMRGKHRVIVAQVHRARIIPAHAGQTCSWPPRPRTTPDHPRACGANTWIM